MRLTGVLCGSVCLAALAALGGCSGTGPEVWGVKAGQLNPESPSYAYVRITPRVLTVLRGASPRLVGQFRDRSRPADIRFGSGDLISITIFEASSGGLFIPAEAGVRPGNFVNIP